MTLYKFILDRQKPLTSEKNFGSIEMGMIDRRGAVSEKVDAVPSPRNMPEAETSFTEEAAREPLLPANGANGQQTVEADVHQQANPSSPPRLIQEETDRGAAGHLEANMEGQGGLTGPVYGESETTLPVQERTPGNDSPPIPVASLPAQDHLPHDASATTQDASAHDASAPIQDTSAHDASAPIFGNLPSDDVFRGRTSSGDRSLRHARPVQVDNGGGKLRRACDLSMLLIVKLRYPLVLVCDS